MVLDVDVVQLQDEFPTTDELLVFVASVGALGLEDLRVEPAGRRDVADDDEWLRPDLRDHSDNCKDRTAAWASVRE